MVDPLCHSEISYTMVVNGPRYAGPHFFKKKTGPRFAGPRLYPFAFEASRLRRRPRPYLDSYLLMMLMAVRVL